MVPPGLGFNAVSDKALAASAKAKLPKSYWNWDEMLKSNKSGFFPYTPATNLLYGLAEALEMLFAEGLDNVFARHDRFAEATRRAVRAWGLDTVCAEPSEYSQSVTAVFVPEGCSADGLRPSVPPPAAPPAAAAVASVIVRPTRVRSAAGTRHGIGATAPITTRAAFTTSPSIVRFTVASASGQSCDCLKRTS